MAVRVEVFTEESFARACATRIADELSATVATRGRATVALSGGRTPLPIYDALVTLDVPWSDIHVFQVDERVAPAEDATRNLTGLIHHLIAPLDGRAPAVHPMPVEIEDLDAAAGLYEAELRAWCGDRPVLDLVLLGVGSDGHTASLVPGDPVLHERDRDVAPSGPYQGQPRLTLTYPALNRARRVRFHVADIAARDAVARALAGDLSVPAARVRAADIGWWLTEAVAPAG